MDLEADPPRGVGPVEIGMSTADALALLRALPGYLDAESADLSMEYESGVTIALETDRGGSVKSIEVYAPGPDSGWRLLLGAVSLFDQPAEAVLAQLAATTSVDVREGGRHVVAPDLLLALWRPTLPQSDDDEDGRYFESVLLARPGYYDDFGEAVGPRST